MRYFRFLQLDPDVEPACFDARRTDHFSLSDADGTTWFYLPLDSIDEAEAVLNQTPSFLRYEEENLKDYVDWGVQWSIHSPDFKNYSLQVDLSKYTNRQEKFPTLHLNAGPGFGDLSHPSTRMTLAMMAEFVQDREVIDIGCGSGILTLASIFLGAKSAIGIDIDPEALAHARENTELNSLQSKTDFFLTPQYKATPKNGSVILMNMIRTHQQEAWAALPQIHHVSGDYFTSGVLASERDEYLEECKQRNWVLITECVQGDWMGFHFRR